MKLNMKKNDKGYVLFELIISMSVTFVIMLQFVSLTLDIYKKNIDLSKQNNLENNIYNLYNEVGYDFLNYNIDTITKLDDNKYKFIFYRNDKGKTLTKTLDFDDNKIIYNELYSDKILYNYELNSDDNIKIDSNKSKLEKINDFIKLTLSINNKDYEFIYSNKMEGVVVP